MGNITKEVMEFVEITKQRFESDNRLTTYRNENYIALRSGMFEDGIRIFELGNELGNFVDWIPRPKENPTLNELEKQAIRAAIQELSRYCKSHIYKCAEGEVDIVDLANKLLQ